MSWNELTLDALIEPAALERAGNRDLPILSMTTHDGLVDQATKFNKRVASADTRAYKVVRRKQLVVGFPIDEGVLSFQNLYDEAIVSPAYDTWELRRDIQVEPAYLERFLRSPRALAFYRTKLRGTTARRRTLPDDIFLKLAVPVPPLPEQRRIVEMLDYAEALRAKRRSALAQLDTLTQSIFLDMFGDPIRNERNLPWKRLIDLVDPARGISYGVVQRGRNVESGVPVLRITDVVDGVIVPGKLKKTASAIADKYRRTVLRGGEIVISIRGTVGSCALVPAELAQGNISRELALLPIEGVSTPFLLALLRTDEVQRQIGGDVKGIAQRGINLEDLRELPVVLPPESEVAVFTRRVRAVDCIRSEYRKSLTALDELFLAIQHRAFIKARSE